MVPKVATSEEATRAARQARKLTRRPSVASVRPGWADLRKRVSAVDGWACPHCAAPMRLRSIVVHPHATTRVVRGLLRATGPPGEGGEGDVDRAFSVA